MLQTPAILLTAEQLTCVDLFTAGINATIEAGAGAGKTSTLRAMGESNKRKRSQYVAFNRPIVLDAAEKMPRNVSARTAHSIARRAIGYRYAHRLDQPRVRSYELGQLLGPDPLVIRKPDGHPKVLQPGYLASLVLKGVVRFCHTMDERPAKEHVPYVDGIDGLAADGRRLWDNNRAVQAHVEQHLHAAWADICDPDGRLPFKHDHYLKIYERSQPHIPADAILFDEAQDASPVMLSIVAQQTHAQQIYVGDSQQQIYSWRGAINALAQTDAQARAFLTQSFRFGPAIADVANVLLDGLDAELRLVGTPTIPSVVARLEHPRCVLTRTNARAMREVLYALMNDVRVHLVGNGEEIERFAKACIDLQTDGQTDYHDLACFNSWGEVLEYVEDDPNGDELTLMVRLMHEYGPRRILDAMRRSSSEDRAELIVSTAHKCSPADEPILTVDGWKAIGDLDPTTDRLAGYARPNNRLTWGARPQQGFAFERSTHDYVGDLIAIETERSRTRVTPNHQVLIAWAPLMTERWAVYLMRRGDWWRVGMCRTTSKPYRSGDLYTRLSAERGDCGWLLSVHESRTEAAKEEARVQAIFGIPGLMFERRHGLLSAADMHDVHESAAGAVSVRVKELFDSYGLLEQFPLYVRGGGAAHQGLFLTAAANIPALSGFVQIPTAPEWFIAGEIHRRGGWSPEQLVAVASREHYEGPVFGLEIPPYHYYVSGNAVVHNSKGREWGTVKIADDFREVHPGEFPEEWRLLYVAVTRAKNGLDVTECTPLIKMGVA